MNDAVVKTFAFKKVVITGGEGQTFYNLVRNAVTMLPMANDRKLELDEDSECYRVLNDWRYLGVNDEVCIVSVFGFTMNANENAVILQNNQQSFPIAVLAPKRDERRHEEFIQGLVWMGIKDNYVTIMTSQSVSFGILEEYFSGLFSRVANNTIRVDFVDPQIPKFGDCDMSTAKRLIISNEITVSETRQNSQQGSIRKSYKPGGGGWGVVKAVCDALGTRPPRLRLTNEHALDQIDVSVVISSKRMSADSGVQLDAIEKVANAFKDVENPPIAVEFQDGRRLSLSAYRITKRFTIPAVNKIPKMEEVGRLLDGWLRKQIGNLFIAHDAEEPIRT